MIRARSPLISVVLPVFNGAQTIAATVKSVLDQEFEDYELLIINDGSTDETLDVLARIDDPRITIHSFENRGLSASRNRGISLAAGEYIAFIDADDLWTPDKLRKQLQALVSDPSAGMAYSLTDCIDEHDAYLGPGSHVIHFGRAYEQLLTRNFIESGSNVLVRRSVFGEAGLFDESLSAAEDWDVFLRIACKYPVVCVPEAQVLYRIHGCAMSSNIERQEFASFRVFEEALRRLPAGNERNRTGRAGRANLNRYFARRVITTAASPRAAVLAFRYIWRWAVMAPDRLGISGKIIIQLVKAVILVTLPHAAARPFLAKVDGLYHRVCQWRLPGRAASLGSRISPVWWANLGPLSRIIGKRIPPAGKPLLIISLPRSGSSWVGETLAQADVAAYLREPVTQTHLSIHPGFSVFEVDPAAVPREYRKSSGLAFDGIPHFGRKVVLYRRQWQLRQRGCRKVMIKEVNPLALKYWQTAFETDVIALVRHPAAVACSLQAKRWSRDTFGRWFVVSRQAELHATIRCTQGSIWAELGASQAMVHREIRECMNMPGRFKLIRYEDICADPLHSFRDLYAFADLKWDDRIESFVRRQTTGHEGESRDDYATRRNSASMRDAWRLRLTDAQIEEVRLGYLGAGGSLYGERDW